MDLIYNEKIIAILRLTQNNNSHNVDYFLLYWDVQKFGYIGKNLNVNIFLSPDFAKSAVTLQRMTSAYASV